MSKKISYKDIPNSDVFMVRPRISQWEKVRAFIANDFYDIDYQIFAPEKFILGQFRHGMEGYALTNHQFFTESPEKLDHYRQHLDSGKLELIGPLFFPEHVLENIVQQGRSFADARQRFTDSVNSLDRYMISMHSLLPIFPSHPK